MSTDQRSIESTIDDRLNDEALVGFIDHPFDLRLREIAGRNFCGVTQKRPF